MLRPSTSAATARHLEDEEGEAEPAGARKPGPRLRTSRGLGAPRASDGDGTEAHAHPRGGDEEKCAVGHVRRAPYRETCPVKQLGD